MPDLYTLLVTFIIIVVIGFKYRKTYGCSAKCWVIIIFSTIFAKELIYLFYIKDMCNSSHKVAFSADKDMLMKQMSHSFFPFMEEQIPDLIIFTVFTIFVLKIMQFIEVIYYSEVDELLTSCENM
jgi:hypothetical protein